MTTEAAIPNPGSKAAIDAGCTCPVLDNGHGKGYMGGAKDPDTGETIFVYSGGCKLHCGEVGA
ncbi:hypothetical protein [Aurantimonas coralicida]|uniref:hypothetical protein n=1 Tax=Aurantimonas coralicida TaxID=182270 RepID=UPI001E5F43F4|nr:hypothetical protein [Aurantimonas coralicida]MCD1645291.1 hypothetical protein [Aurantimonas coralicida]